ncbi:hypothetical protein VKT23_014609 [Stygiomarasmius scandens]|uniref:Uncharacterized protein n=1 Tax=Marasmiellus scandens TaxID=2682957 RepID=A0ABR1J2X0_9AGAR
MDSYEMTDLSKRPSEERKDGQTLEDNSISLWAMTSACSFTLLSAVLLFFPRLLLFISETTSPESRPSLTPLERFLATHFGIWLTAIAISLVLTMPSSSPLRTPNASTHPLLVTTTASSLFSAFVSYNTSSVGTLATLYTIISGIVGIWGLWALVFEGSSRVSKMGADKHTSSFIFGNKSSASRRKKQWKKETRSD